MCVVMVVAVGREPPAQWVFVSVLLCVVCARIIKLCKNLIVVANTQIIFAWHQSTGLARPSRMIRFCACVHACLCTKCVVSPFCLWERSFKKIALACIAYVYTDINPVRGWGALSHIRSNDVKRLSVKDRWLLRWKTSFLYLFFWIVQSDNTNKKKNFFSYLTVIIA